MYKYKLTRVDLNTGSTHSWYIREKHIVAAVENHNAQFPHCELRMRKATDEEIAHIYRGI